MFESLKIGIFKFILNAGAKGLDLPKYYGSTLRGAFGHSFKRIACVDIKKTSCHECEIETHCPYAYIFESTSGGPEDWMGKFDDVPRPFMFLPELEAKQHHEPDEELELEVRLFGKGIDFFPYFVLAFIQMGEHGLGYQRKSYRLKKVLSLNPILRSEQLVYDGERNRIYTPRNVVSGDTSFSQFTENTKQVRISYITPLRLKENGRLLQTVEFSYLIRSLLRRATAILYFHHGIKLELDFRELVDRSHEVKRVKDLSEWFEFERYSSRQGEKMKLGGVIGEVTYEGKLVEFLPLLEFGRWVGAGKNNVFGLGQMDYVSVI